MKYHRIYTETKNDFESRDYFRAEVYKADEFGFPYLVKKEWGNHNIEDSHKEWETVPYFTTEPAVIRYAIKIIDNIDLSEIKDKLNAG